MLLLVTTCWTWCPTAVTAAVYSFGEPTLKLFFNTVLVSNTYLKKHVICTIPFFCSFPYARAIQLPLFKIPIAPLCTLNQFLCMRDSSNTEYNTDSNVACIHHSNARAIRTLLSLVCDAFTAYTRQPGKKQLKQKTLSALTCKCSLHDSKHIVACIACKIAASTYTKKTCVHCGVTSNLPSKYWWQEKCKFMDS